MNRKVFISFDYNDAAFANALKSALHDKQVYIASDVVSREVEPSYIKKAVLEKIKTADAVVVLLSKNAIQRHWVLFEMGVAQGLDKQVIPVLTPGTKMNKLITRVLGDIPILDANNKSISQTVDELQGILART